MKKTQRFFALILCVAMLFSILGCGQNKPQPSQTVQESAPAPESVPEIIPSTDEISNTFPELSGPEDNYYLSFSFQGNMAVRYTYNSDNKALIDNDGGYFTDYAIVGNDYYYITNKDMDSYESGKYIYHITATTEPKLLYETSGALTLITASKDIIYFVENNNLCSIDLEGKNKTEYGDIGKNTALECHDSGIVTWVRVCAENGILIRKSALATIDSFNGLKTEYGILSNGEIRKSDVNEYMEVFDPKVSTGRRYQWRYDSRKNVYTMHDGYTGIMQTVFEGEVYNSNYNINNQNLFIANGSLYGYLPFQEPEIIFESGVSSVYCDKKKIYFIANNSLYTADQADFKITEIGKLSENVTFLQKRENELCFVQAIENDEILSNKDFCLRNNSAVFCEYKIDKVENGTVILSRIGG